MFVTSCHAEGLQIGLSDLGEVRSLQELLPETEREIAGELRFDGSYDSEGALQRLWFRLLSELKKRISAELHAMLELFVLSLVCVLSSCLCRSDSLSALTDRIGCCAAVLIISEDLNGLLTQASECIRQFSDYSRAVLPVIFTAAAGSGAIVSASARFASACLVMDVMIMAAQEFILPCIYMYFSVTICASLFEAGILRAAERLCRWIAVTAMTVLTLSFGAYLSITGLIAGSSDALAVKTARTIISRSLPIVGGLLSDSAGILLSAAELVKRTAGVFALISVCALCIGPSALLGVKYLVFKGVAAASEFLPESRLPKLIGSVSSVFGLLLGLIGCCAVLLFVAIISGMKTVVPG